MLNRIRKNAIVKWFMVFMSLNVMFNGLFIRKAYANGPSQPDMQGPSAASVDNMVDPFTGDFSYAVPLFEMGDIPLTLNYNAGISMEQESSWVGLGWSLNPGSITRTVRGLPDDNYMDNITDKQHIRPNETVGIGVSTATEIVGMDLLSPKAGLNLTYNNYSGFDLALSFSPSISAGDNASLGLTIGSQSSNDFGDIGISPSYNWSKTLEHAESEDGKVKSDVTVDNTIGIGFSTTKGLESVSFNRQKNFSVWVAGENKDGSGSHTYSTNLNKMNIGASTSNLFNDQSYSPGIDHPFKNYQFSLRLGAGGNITVADQSLFLDGYYSGQFVDAEEIKKYSYGYLYSENATGDALLDFNRESGGQLEEGSPVLSPSYLTYDIYSLSSPGLSGTFRAYRNDVGYVEENDVEGTSTSASFGGEFSIGNLISPGLDISATFGGCNSTEWTESNEVDDMMRYSSKKVPESKDEHVYFAMMDDVTAESDPDFVSKIGAKQPIAFDVEGFAGSTSLRKSYDTYSAGSNITLADGAKMRDTRKTRNTNISYMTVGEVAKYYPNQRHKAYEDTNPMHVARMVVTSSDGTRYVYGLPVYNLEQDEVCFNIGKSGRKDDPAIPDANNQVAYTTAQNGLTNESGIDHYYKETVSNSYAYEYLLTEILSPDYVDVTGDGPTQDDLGNYVAYTYGVDPDHDGVYEVNIPAYKWRTPITLDEFKANYFEGFKSDASDDKANYVYGTKEIWYLNKIETKDYTAVMTTSTRHDGNEVKGPDGGIDDSGSLLRELDAITLYANSEIVTALDLDVDPKPLKTISFQYDYSLCVGYPLNENSEEGKLTLTGLVFKYNESNKARFSNYKFGYDSGDPENDFENPVYSFTSNDRWGNFKPEPGGDVKNRDFPYVNQEDANLDYYASAWCLKTINTPTGGTITINYESDDYAYVQDQQAAQMVQILDAKTSPGVPAGSDYKLYNGSTYNNCLMFAIPEIPIGEDPDEWVKKSFVLGDDLDPTNPVGIAKNLYFKIYTNTNKGISPDPDEGYDYEYVSGYGELDLENHPTDYAGAYTSGGSTYGYIYLKPESAKFSASYHDVSPIVKAGWQYCMQNVKYNILDQSPPGDPGDETFLQAMADIFFVNTIVSFFSSPNNQMENKGFAKLFDPEKSWIRLQNPSGHKKGGGYRIKSIKISDNWDSMTAGESEFNYGQEYSYNLEDGRSSGVAAYEPSMGGDENPLKRPLWYNFKPDKEYRYRLYKEKPFGENYFPAPVVGYSHVEIKNLSRDGVDIKRTSTGKVVNEYYTAKDFPFRATYTTLNPTVFKPDPVLSLFKIASINSYTGTQGFCFETNNMHGKPKSVSVFAEGQDEALSKTSYHYKTDPATGHLQNYVDVIYPDASIPESPVEVGVTYDLTLDFRKSTNWSIGGPIKGGLDAFFAGFPLAIPSALAQYNYSNHTTKLSIATKVVNTNGIIDYIETTQDGSTVKQNNTLFDAKTGAPIITSTQNEFNDNYYTVNYPAHWAISGMSLSCDNDDYMFQSTESGDKIDWTTGQVIDGDIVSMLEPGDEIGLIGRIPSFAETASFGNEGVWAWVYNVTTPDLYHIAGYYLVDRNGEVPNFAEIADAFDGADEDGIIQATVYRSGKRNMAGSSIQSYITKNEPIDGGFPETVDEDLGIISATASTYSDIWQKTCLPLEESPDTYCNCTETLAGHDFQNMVDQLFHNSIVYDEGDSWPQFGFGTADLHQRDDVGDYSTDSYFNGFTTLLAGIFEGYSDATEYDTNIKIVNDEEDDNLLHVVIDNNPLGELCDFDFIFGYPLSPIDLSDEEVFIDVFGNPDELTIDFGALESETCTDGMSFTMTLHYINDLGDPDSIVVLVKPHSDEIGCLTFLDCTTYTYEENYCSGSIDETVNPYVKGLLGIWYPNIEYSYLTDRTPGSYADADDIELRVDGTFEKFTPFWKWYDIAENWDQDPTDWVWTVQSNLGDASIGQLQTFNPLNIHSATLFGHNKTITEMIADNATYKNIGFENFEDNDYITMLDKACHQEHFDFSLSPGEVTHRYAHSGNYSLFIADDGDVTYSTALTVPSDDIRSEYPQPFKISTEDCIPVFEPDADLENDVTYLFTFWAKQDFDNDEPVFDFDDIDVSLLIDASSIPITISRGDIIEGWQRFECEFTIVDGSTGDFDLTISNGTGDDVYIDDIRIMPKNAMAKCYVFDYKTRWLMAELDENHFATFYEYDEDGKLIRVKKETEKGIMTIQEGRYFSVKHDVN